MKSKIMLTLMSLFCMMALYSCFPEEDMKIDKSATETEIDEMQAMQIPPIAILPDLVIDAFTSTLPITQGPCPGGPWPNATCTGGGNPFFSFSATVRNRSVVPIAPGCFDICWNLFGSGTSTQTINHNGIPANGSIDVTSAQFSLPCPMGPIIGLELKTFFAEVDCTDKVNEANENNNFSRRYKVCDDI